MSTTGKIGLLVALVVVIVGGFVLLQPAEVADDGDSADLTQMPQRSSEPPRRSDRDDGPVATAESAHEPPPIELTLADHGVRGGVQMIEASKGDLVRLVVKSDIPDEIHLHGYDVEKHVEPGKPARFRLEADIEGQFEIEGHAAEHGGKDPLIARLVVKPG